MQVDSIESRVESAYGFSPWKLTYDEPLSNFAFECNLRRYLEGTGGGINRVVFVAECRSAKNSSDFLRLAAEHARAAALDGSGISPDVVVLIKPRTLPKVG